MNTLTVPGNHLLGSADTLGLVVLAVDWGLGRGELAVRRGVCNMALVVGHVHVGLTTAIRNPKPGAVAAARRAGRKVLRDVICGQSLPRSMFKDRKDD